MAGKKTVKHYRRHQFLNGLLRFVCGPPVKFLMGYRCRAEKTSGSANVIIANHNTDLDPALVVFGLGHTYFVASEHAFRKGFRSKLLAFLFDPIPINKAHTDSSTLKEMFNIIKAGFNVCLFAEGDRSFNGVTGEVAVAAAKMVKISGAGLITYRLEGGYFTSPRWAKNMRKGKMSGGITGRYSAEELKSMKPDQILSLIEKGIHEDAYARQGENPVRYRGKNLAENIETVLYLCPVCKKIGTIRSKGDRFFCGCGLSAVYTETGFLEKDVRSMNETAPDLPFATITEWDKWQVEYLKEVINNSGGETICEDEDQQLFTLDLAHGTIPAGEGTMRISRTEFQCGEKIFPLEQIERFAIVGQMTLLFALKDGTQYEVRSAFPRSALKYREIFSILQEG